MMLSLAACMVAGWTPIEVEVTAYCSCALCTPGKGVTANGTRTADVPYDIAVSRDAEKLLPMNSVVWIPTGAGYLDSSRANDRMFVVDDRMKKTAASKTGRPLIDLRYKTHASAQKFGRKVVTVYKWEDE